MIPETRGEATTRRRLVADHMATIATFVVLAVMLIGAGVYLVNSDAASCERGNVLRLYATIDNDSRMAVLRERLASPEQLSDDVLASTYRAELDRREALVPALVTREC